MIKFEHKKLEFKVNRWDSSADAWADPIFFDSKQEKAEWLQGLIKLPGEQGLDHRIERVNVLARKFDKKGYYTETLEGTHDYRKFWEWEKELCYTGILIDDEYYVTGDHYFYLNFLKIPDKVKGGQHFPTLFDTDIWVYQNLELSRLLDKFIVCVKKRQIGISLKILARMIKRLWFEEGFSGKISSFEDKFVKANWSILVKYRSHLNEHTGWYRSFEAGDKMNDWTQGFKKTIGDREVTAGNLSTIKGITTQSNPAAVVSGKTDEGFFDEAGVWPNLSEVIELLSPALKFGNILTGTYHVWGAVGELKNSKPLQKMMMNPDDFGFLSFPNIWSNRPDERVGLFIPEYYSYGDCMDEYGNSLIEEAKKQITKEEQIAKSKDYKSYIIYKAQHPQTLEDAFATQEENPFPTDLVQMQLEALERQYKEVSVTLEYSNHPSANNGVRHIIGATTQPITDYPLKQNDDRRGAVVIDEPPMKNPPFGLYYVTIDPIKPINSSTSESLHAVYVYKAAHKIDNEFSEDKIVAWYCGRHDDPYATYEISKKLILYYNARVAIENDQPSCIEWLIKEKMQNYLMKRSQMPILKEWVPNSTINEEIGWRTGSGNTKIKENFWALIIEYIKEEIGQSFNMETGESLPIYGVSRIKDKALLKEILAYTSKTNVDRMIAFGAALMVSRSNTNRGVMVVKKERNDNHRMYDTKTNKKSNMLGGGLRGSKFLKSPFRR